MAAQPIQTATNQPYGVAKQQADAQRAVPLPRNTGWQAPVVPLHAPTMRPDENVMAGTDAGPGPTAAEAGVPVHDDGTPEAASAIIRGIFAATQNPALMAVVQAIEGTFNRQDPGTAGLSDLSHMFGNWNQGGQ